MLIPEEWEEREEEAPEVHRKTPLQLAITFFQQGEPSNIIRVVVLIGHEISWSGLNQLKSEAFYTGHIGDRGYSSVTTNVSGVRRYFTPTTTLIVVHNFILRVHDFILSVRNFILRVHDFILREQSVVDSCTGYSTVTDFARFLG